MTCAGTLTEKLALSILAREGIIVSGFLRCPSNWNGTTLGVFIRLQLASRV
jgi:hypothetical protein